MRRFSVRGPMRYHRRLDRQPDKIALLARITEESDPDLVGITRLIRRDLQRLISSSLADHRRRKGER